MRHITPACALTWLLGVAASSAGETFFRSALFGPPGAEVERFWIEYRPDGLDPAGTPPVVLALHPGAQSAADFLDSSGWERVADRAGIVVLYPQATPGAAPAPGTWNAWDWDGAPDPDGTPAFIAQRDDLGYLVALIDLVTTRDEFAADPARVYMTGFSSGAQMTATYLGAGVARGADQLAAAAPVSGGWCEPFGVDPSFADPFGPVPIWQWRGEDEDSLTPAGVSRLVHDELQRAFWIDANGQSDTPDTTETITGTYAQVRPVQAEIEQTFVTDIHGPGDGGVNTGQPLAEFRYTTVLGRGHQYHPGAAEEIWDRFFARFARGGAAACNAADVNGDGTLDFGDVIAFIEAFDAGSLAADLNADGALGFADTVRFIAAYNAGCP